MTFDTFDASPSLKALLIKEMKPYYDLRRQPNYIPLPHENMPFRESWRVSIAEWIFGVIDHFDLNREVAAIALDFIDRYYALEGANTIDMAAGIAESKSNFQKVAVGSLYLAIKVHGQRGGNDRPIRPSLRLFTELARGVFSEQEIEQMEMTLLFTLSWYIHPPTASAFVGLFILELKPLLQHHTKLTPRLYEQSVFLTELSVCTPGFNFCFKPSTVAFAAILASEELMVLQHQERILPQYIMSAFVDCVLHWTHASLPIVRDCQQRLMLAAPVEDLTVPDYGIVRPEAGGGAVESAAGNHNNRTQSGSPLDNNPTVHNHHSSVLVSPGAGMETMLEG